MSTLLHGNIFDIQHFSIHDGPGIRTLVFFKGCPASCKWCANPESQKPTTELGYKATLCIGDACLLCQTICPANAIFLDENASSVGIDWSRCTQCQKCTEVCPAKALETYGKIKTIDDILAAVKKDSVFYLGNGGVTLSGGEVLLQADFACALLAACHEEGFHTAIETCGAVPWEQAMPVFSACDYILYDIKSLNDSKHKANTGLSNQLILDNFLRLVQNFPSKAIHVRTPVIPGFNDTREDIAAIASFLKDRAPHVTYELLKYHRYGEGKYAGLGRIYPMGDTELDEKKFHQLTLLKQQLFDTAH